MIWADLRSHYAKLVVEQTAQGVRLAIHPTDGQRIPVTVRGLGFEPGPTGKWVSRGKQLGLNALRRVFPRAVTREMDPDVVDGDPLRRLRDKLRQTYGPTADVQNFSPVSPDAATQLRARAVAQLLGVKTQFLRYAGDDPRLDFAGVALRDRGDRTVYVNVDAPFSALATLGHEAVHVMRRNDPQLYDDLVSGLRPLIDQGGFARYAQKMHAGNVRTDGRRMALDEIREEAVADCVGDMLLDPEVWAAIDDRDLLERLLQWLADFLQSLAVRWQRDRPEMDRTLGSRELLHDLVSAREVVVETLRAWRDAPAGVASRGKEASDAVIALRTAIDGPRPPADIFPASAIRDTEGHLRVVFRGEWGPEAVHPFDATRLGAPTFSISPDIAEVYATGSDLPEATPRVRACVLDIRRPLQLGSPDEDVVDFGAVRDALTASGDVSDQEVREAWSRLSGYLRHYPPSSLGNPLADEDPDCFTLGFHHAADISDIDYTDTHTVADSDGMRQLAERAGFDGFVYTGTFTSPDRFSRSLDECIEAGFDDAGSMAVEYRPFRRDQVHHVFSDTVPTALRTLGFRKLFHGSPHAFDWPDLGQVLTGEGMNAQGHGFYMAEEMAVAENYQRMLARRNQPFVIDGAMYRRFDLPEKLPPDWDDAERAAATALCDLLADGRYLDDVRAICESRPLPERDVLLSVLNKIQRVGQLDIRGQRVYITHRTGVDTISRGRLAAGYTRAQFDLGYFVAAGQTVEQARRTVLAEQAQRIVGLRAELAEGLSDERRQRASGNIDGVDRAQTRVRDTRWFLVEAESTVAVLGDSGTLVFDVEGWHTDGHLYEADLRDDALLLDWDLSLDDQHAKVQEALSALKLLPADTSALGSRFYQDLEASLSSAEKASAALMAAGLSGVRYRDGQSRQREDGVPTFNYVIWDITAIDDFQMKFAGRAQAADEGAEPLYSALLAAVEAGRGAPKRASATGWRQWLDGAQRRGEFRQAERDWLAVDDWLASHDTITRKDLGEYVRTHQLSLRRVMLGPSRHAPSIFDDHAPKFGTLQLPGGTNYRELLVSMDSSSRSYSGFIQLRESASAGADELVDDLLVAFGAEGLEALDYGRDPLDDTRIRFTALASSELDQIRQVLSSQGVPAADIEVVVINAEAADAYASPHFAERNILVHARLNERTDEAGRRVLFVEELQSDWHQRGRQAGYGVEGGRVGSVTDAPFKGSTEWSLLGLRHIAAIAVREGFDAIAWTRGDQQVDRYRLSLVASAIEWHPDGDDKMQRRVHIEGIDRGQGRLSFEVDNDGRTRCGDRRFHDKLIHEVVGIGLGEQIMASVDGRISGADLKIGNAGLGHYYDTILPAVAGKWARRLGGKLESFALPVGTAAELAKDDALLQALGASPANPNNAMVVTGVSITPAMRDALEAGQPMFKRDVGSGAISDEIFYSALLSALTTSRSAPHKGTGEAWLQWLDGAQRRGEVRQPEREWLGVDTWLAAQNGNVDKRDLIDFVRRHQVQLQEVVHANTATRHDEHVLPGGTKYRELLMTFPQGLRVDLTEQLLDCGFSPESENGALLRVIRLSDGEVFHHADHMEVGSLVFADLPPDVRKLTAAMQQSNELHFISPAQHFAQPDILVHVRFNERVGENGTRLLHIEELQSDWHQQGRKQGYRPAIPGVADARLAFEEACDGRSEHPEVWRANNPAAAAILQQAEDFAEAVPNAPFKRSEEWSLLAVKRMVRWAAENGFDGLTWTTGAQQVERFNLGGNVAEATVKRVSDGWQLGLLSTDGRWLLRDDVVGSVDELVRCLGKEIADTAKDLSLGEKMDFANVNKPFGGEGLRLFYDRILPKTVSAWAKQFGAKIDFTAVPLLDPDDDKFEVVLPNGKVVGSYARLQSAQALAADYEGANVVPIDGNQTQPTLMLTPSMRDAALQGLPLFRRQRSEAAEYRHDERTGNLVVIPKPPAAAHGPSPACPLDESDHGERPPVAAMRF